MNEDSLKQELKEMIIDVCDKEDDIELDDFENDMTLIGFRSALELDSLDALQISMAVQQTYGVRLEGSTSVRKAMKDINTLAAYIIANKPS